MLLDSDPNTNSFVRVWGAPSRTAEGKRRGAYLEDALVAGKALGELAKTGQMAAPLAQSSLPGWRASLERVREKGKV